MSEYMTPFADMKKDNSDDNKDNENNTVSTSQPSGIVLDEAFDGVIPTAPVLDEYLLQATEHHERLESKKSLPSMPSRLLTLSVGKSLSTLASLDLSWLAEGQGQHAVGNAKQTSVSVVGPERVGSIAGLAEPSPLDIRPVCAEQQEIQQQQQQQEQTGYTQTATQINHHALCAAVQAAYTSLMEAQYVYAKALESLPPSCILHDQGQFDKIAAIQQTVLLHQANYCSLMAQYQSYKSTTSASDTSMIAPQQVSSTIPTSSSVSKAGQVMAEWAQEKALMQALNSQDMETAVQAIPGVLEMYKNSSSSNYKHVDNLHILNPTPPLVCVSPAQPRIEVAFCANVSTNDFDSSVHDAAGVAVGALATRKTIRTASSEVRKGTKRPRGRPRRT